MLFPVRGLRKEVGLVRCAHSHSFIAPWSVMNTYMGILVLQMITMPNAPVCSETKSQKTSAGNIWDRTTETVRDVAQIELEA